MKDTETADSAFSHGGIAVIPAVLVYAVLHTALSEEILFRGFLLKRIANRFGFVAGNTIQAVLFGIIHAVGFFNQVYRRYRIRDGIYQREESRRFDHSELDDSRNY